VDVPLLAGRLSPRAGTGRHAIRGVSEGLDDHGFLRVRVEKEIQIVVSAGVRAVS